MGQIRMLQKIEHEVGIDRFREVFAAIVNKRRKNLVDIESFDPVAILSVL